MIAGQLELQLVADVARLRDDMAKMNGIVSRGAQGMQQALDDVRRTLGGLFTGVSVAGFGMWIKSAIDFADELNDLNKTTSISVERLSGLALMSKQTGSDLTGMAQAMNKLALEMGKAPEKFRAIGITAKDPLEAFKQLSDIFRGIEDPQLRAAVAAEALGKGWASAAPALAEGSAEIEKMVRRGEELAGITKEDTAAADQFNDSVSELQTAIMGSATVLARDMLPVLTELVRSLTEVTHNSKEADAGFSPLTETMRALAVVGGNVAFVFRGVGIEIGGVAAQLAALNLDPVKLATPGGTLGAIAQSLTNGGFRQFLQIGEEMREDAEKNRAAFDAWEQRMMSAGKAAKTATADFRESERALRSLGGGVSTGNLRAFVGGDGKGGGRSAAAAVNKELEQEKRILAELAGVNADYIEQLQLRVKMLAAGKITQDQYNQSVIDLIAKQPGAKKMMEEQNKLLEEERKAREAVRREVYEQVLAYEKVVGSEFEANENLRREIELIGLTEEAKTRVLQKRNEETIAIKEAELAELQRHSTETGTMTRREIALEEEIRLLRERNELLGVKGVKEANAQAAEAAKSEWDQVAQSMTDALMNGGKSAAEYLKGLFRTLVLRPILEPIGKAISGALGGMGFPLGGGSGGGAGGGGFNLSGLAGKLGLPTDFSMFGLSGAQLLNIGGVAIGGSMLATTLGEMLGLKGDQMKVASVGGAFLGGIPGAILGKLVKPGGGPKTESGYGIGVPHRGDSSAAQAAAAAMLAQYQAIAGPYARRDLDLGLFTAADPQGDAMTQLAVEAAIGGRSIYSRGGRLGGIENVGRSEGELAAAVGEETHRVVVAALRESDLPADLAEWVRTLDGFGSKEMDAALARVQKILTERQVLEARIFDLSSTDMEKLTRFRQQEWNAVDESNRAMLGRVYQLEDEARAAEKAKAILDERTALEDRYFELAGTEWERIARLREREWNATEESNRKLLARIYILEDEERAQRDAQAAAEEAQRAIEDAQRAAAETQRDFAELIEGVRNNVRQYIDQLNGTDAGGLSPEQQLWNSRQAFWDQLMAAQGGNRDAIGNITQYADRYIDAQRGWSASGGDTQNVIEWIKWELAHLPENIRMPGFAVGTDYVPYDMVARVHQGERIVPRWDNPHANPYTSDSAPVVAAIDRLCTISAEGHRRSVGVQKQIEENTSAAKDSGAMARSKAVL